MRVFFADNRIIRIQDGGYVCYVFEEDSLFSLMEYKVMKGWMKGNLVRCERMKYNGKLRLIYFTEGLIKLDNYFDYAEERSICSVVVSYLKMLIAIRKNGFLDCRNLSVGREDLFVDESKEQVMMLYLPVERSESAVNYDERQMRRILYEMVLQKPRKWSVSSEQWLKQLIDFTVSVEELCRGFQQDDMESGIREVKAEIFEPPVQEREKCIILQAVNTSLQFRIELKNNEIFVIGKSAQLADGVIPDNKTISRRHCEISMERNIYYIRDLNSLNGTFLNNVRLTQEKRRLEEKQIVKIANMSFVVKM